MFIFAPEEEETIYLKMLLIIILHRRYAYKI